MVLVAAVAILVVGSVTTAILVAAQRENSPRSITYPTPISQPAAVIACRQAVHTLREFDRDATKTYLPATKLGLNDSPGEWLRAYREIGAEWSAIEVELDAIVVPEELELILALERQFVGSVRMAAEEAAAHTQSRQIQPEDWATIYALASGGNQLHDVATDRLVAFDPASCDRAGEPPQI